MNKQELKDAIIAERKRHDETMKDLTSKLRVFEMEDARRASAEYAERKKLLDATGNWLNKNKILKVGDLVQVTGSRAGKYRVIAGFTYYGVIGKVATERKEKQMDGTIQNVWSTSALQVTEQGLNKITHIYRKGQFVPVKELMQAWEDQKPSLE